MPNRDHPDIQIDDFMRDRFHTWSETRMASPAFGYDQITPMDRPARDQWIEALESEEFDQVTGYLKVDIGVGFAYCCWGVLCEIKDVPSTDQPTHQHTHTRGVVWDFRFDGLPEEDDGTEIPPTYWTGRYGIQQPVVNGLAEANDHGYNFGEIAGWIRKYL
jgi:hypothetical protein